MRRRTLTLLAIFLSSIWTGSTWGFAASSSTLQVELPSALHFLSPAGDDVEVGPGNYKVDATESWLKLVPEGEGPESAVLIEAASGTHEETVMEPVVRLEGESGNPDIFHLAMLLQDGTGLEAVGTVSGIRPRSLSFAYMKTTTKKGSRRFSYLPFSRPRVQIAQQKKSLPQGKKVCGPFQKQIKNDDAKQFAYRKAGRGNRAPALAVFQNKLHLVTRFDASCKGEYTVVGTCLGQSYKHPLHHRIYENGKWGKRKRISNQYSKEGVGLAVQGNRLHMVHLGNSSNQLWYSTYDGKKWTPLVKILGQKSKKRPTLATYQNEIHMVHLGDRSNDLWHSRFIPGRGWTVNVRIPRQKSEKTPGLAVYQNRLHMVHSGDRSKDLWHSSFFRNEWSKNYRIPKLKSQFTPALAFDTKNPKPWLELIHFKKDSAQLMHSLYGSHQYRGSTRRKVEWFDEKPLLNRKSASPVSVAFFEGCWHMVSVKNDSLMHTTYATADIHPQAR